MARCPNCDSTPTGCLCSVEDSFSVTWTGSGNPSNPLIPTVPLNPSTDNLLTETPTGLLALLPINIAAPPFVITKRDTNQSIASTTETNIIFSGVLNDPLSMWDAADPENVAIPYDGLWAGLFQGRFASNATGGRRFIVYLNAGNEIGVMTVGANPAAGETTRLQAVVPPVIMFAGDRVHVSAYQTSGTSLNVLTQSNNSPQLRLWRIGDIP